MEKIYFIRHKFKELSSVIEKHCLEHKCVAIHFNPEFYVEFSDYSEEAQNDKSFKQAFSIFNKIAQEGSIVVTEYNKSEFFVGEVFPNASIEPFNYGKRIGETDDFYKTINLQNIKGPFSYADYPLMSALKPPFVTVCMLSDYSRNIILHLYKNTPLALDVRNLHPKMLEQMCEEWLRTDLAGELKVKFGLLKTGKTLPIIDMYARTLDDTDLLVQITHANEKSKVMDKAARLEDYLANKISERKTIGVFFAPAESEKYLKETNLVFIAIEHVFKQLTELPSYSEMLKTMIGINDQAEDTIVKNTNTAALRTAQKIKNLVSKTNKDLLEYGSLRQLLDCYSDEWRRTSSEQKIQIYKHLFLDSKFTEGQLLLAIQEYADFYDSINEPEIKGDIIESLVKTLKNIFSDYSLIKK